jgi:gluconate 2-dehydrogenase
MSKPKLLVARRIFAETLQALRQHFEVEDNPADVVWSPLELTQRLQGKDAAFITGSERIDAPLLAACPQLKMVATMFVGYNNIDVPACSQAGVLASYSPEVLTETTADMGFMLMMAAARRLAESEHFLRGGQWDRWSIDLLAGFDVHGSTLGILGMGRIGQAIARRGAHGFGMPVLYHNRSRLDVATEAQLGGARWVEKDELLRGCDHLMIVVPYSAQTHHAVGAAELAMMKPTATLTNIARGGVVDDAALAQALKSRTIAAAGLDVYEGEPKVHPGLLEVPNVVLAPHIGSATLATRRAMADLAATNLIEAFAGRTPPTPINPELWPQWLSR